MTMTTNRAFGFLLDEDNALKMKLQNYGIPFTVNNYADNTAVPITVYFRSPDQEIRTRTFPHFTIDLIDVVPDEERMHRAPEGATVPYPTETATPLPGTVLTSDDFPFPWMLHYQISAISRDPTHDRQLGQLLFRMFPYQYGSLDMGVFDGTVRRADLLSTTRQDLPGDANQKRIYRQIFTIGVSSEFYLNQLTEIQRVLSINTTVETTQGTF